MRGGGGTEGGRPEDERGAAPAHPLPWTGHNLRVRLSAAHVEGPERSLRSRSRDTAQAGHTDLPGMDGIASTERIAEESPQSRAVVLTTFELDQ